MSAQKAMNVRNRGQALQSKLSHAAKQSLDRRFGALYDKIYREDVLWEAWRRVRANKGAPGLDRQSIEHIEEEIGVERFLDHASGCDTGRGDCVVLPAFFQSLQPLAQSP